MELLSFDISLLTHILDFASLTHRQWCNLRLVCKSFQKIIESLKTPLPQIYLVYLYSKTQIPSIQILYATIYRNLVPSDEILIATRLCADKFTLSPEIDETEYSVSNGFKYGGDVLAINTNFTKFIVGNRLLKFVIDTSPPMEGLFIERRDETLSEYPFDIQNLFVRKVINFSK